ncbi:MAG TPA: hypothetical protein VEL28_16770 [Candidatus Binatia bacterium]|nr:hypothetical protein [Candidatus Binatia bacterium]
MITERNSEDRSFRQLSQTIQTDLSAVKSTATDFEQQLNSFVRERPVAAVLTALGLGFVVARIFSRR